MPRKIETIVPDETIPDEPIVSGETIAPDGVEALASVVSAGGATVPAVQGLRDVAAVYDEHRGKGVPDREMLALLQPTFTSIEAEAGMPEKVKRAKAKADTEAVDAEVGEVIGGMAEQGNDKEGAEENEHVPAKNKPTHLQEQEQRSGIEDESAVQSKRSFTAMIGEMLMRVKSKQQAKLTAEDLGKVVAWLEEDSTQIDGWIVDASGKRYTPLRMAASLGENAVIGILLDHGSKVIEEPDPALGATPLLAAATYGQAATIALLLDRGSQAIDTVDSMYESTPLIHAALFGRLDAATLLLDRGSQAIDTPNKIQETPLSSALKYSRDDIVQLLIERGVDRKGKSDLFVAAALGDTEEVQRLLDVDSSKIDQADDEFNSTALEAAVFYSRGEVVELLMARGAAKRGMTEVYMAACLGKADEVAAIVADGCEDIDMPVSSMFQATPLWAASHNGHTAVLSMLVSSGSTAINKPDGFGGQTPLQAVIWRSIVNSSRFGPMVKLLLANGARDSVSSDSEVSSASKFLAGIGTNRAYNKDGSLVSSTSKFLRAHESFFAGIILKQRGIPCIASWPGIYAKLFDTVVERGKAGSLSAAVLFLPENTENYGKCGSDKCYCEEIYGKLVPWGCKWFQLWRGHVKEAVALGQRLQVYFCEGRRGEGKVASWAAMREDAVKRDSFWPRRRAFLSSLPAREQARLAALSSVQRDDSAGERPGSERGDAEEALFLASLPASDRSYLEGHKGLGNSQKAEVAWLERQGVPYEEVDVRDYALS